MSKITVQNRLNLLIVQATMTFNRRKNYLNILTTIRLNSLAPPVLYPP